MEPGLEGQLITREDFDYALAVRTSSEVDVRIGAPFSLETPGQAPRQLDPDGPAPEWWDGPTLLDRTITRAEVSESGALELRLSGDLVLSVSPDDDFEAWTITERSGSRIVCTPGGEIVTFG